MIPFKITRELFYSEKAREWAFVVVLVIGSVVFVFNDSNDVGSF
jgi:hypothetical protein